MILPSDRWMPGDLESWEQEERHDDLHAIRPAMARREKHAIGALLEFFRDNPSGYLGVSWGKDSVVVAHLLWRSGLDVPVVWVKIDPLYNPDCELVRDAFLERFDVEYHELVVPWRDDQCEHWRTLANSGSLNSLGFSPPESAAAPGFQIARKRFGARHVSGVRAQESTVRYFRMAKYGENSPNTCAPIGRWHHRDVFAYLHRHDLPVHPAYAMTFGGALYRQRIRVDALGGGKGSHRSEWEGRYYADRIREICEIATSQDEVTE